MSKHQEGLFRHSALLFAFSQLANACNVVFHVILGRALSNDEYGIMSAMLGIMLAIGTPLEALRLASAHFAGRANIQGEPGAVKRLIRKWAVRLALVALPVAVVGFAGAPHFMRYFHLDSPLPLWITVLGVIGTLFVPLLAGCLQGLQAFISLSAALQGLSFIRLGVGVALVYLVSRTAVSGVAGHVIGVYVATGVGLFALWRLLRGLDDGTMATKGVGLYAIKSLAMLAGFAMIMNVDVILVRHYLPESAGLFSYGATIGRTIVFLPMPIAFALFPKVVSSGEMTLATRTLLLKGLAMVVALVGAGVVGCLLFPWLPLKILYGKAEPEAMHNVRIMMMALAPMSITYILMNFEIAQHRFRCAPWLLVCAAAYLGGVALFHESVNQIVLILGLCSTASALVFVLGVPWRVQGARP
jgi:O-antigen/teichoic acid export membrane protein